MDSIIIPFGPEILVLTPAEFAAARDRGRALQAPVATAAPKADALVTADEVARDLSLPKSCVYAYAKAGRIPCVRAGKHVRFNTSHVLAALKEAGMATVGHS